MKGISIVLLAGLAAFASAKPYVVHVLNADGTPAAKVHVRVSKYTDVVLVINGDTDAKGDFTMDRPQTGASVMAWLPGNRLSVGMLQDDGVAKLAPTVPFPKIRLADDEGRPVSNAEVHFYAALSDQGPVLNLSNSHNELLPLTVHWDGTITGPEIPVTSTISVYATHQGYLPLQAMLTAKTLNANQPLSFAKGAQISGQVTYQGKPVAGAQVIDKRLEVGGAYRQETQGRPAVTDSQGNYTLTVKPGTTNVMVSESPDKSLISPTLKDIVAKSNVNLSGVDLRLHKGILQRVLVITAEDHKPLKGVQVSTYAENNRSDWAMTDQAGFANFFVPECDVSVSLAGTAGHRFSTNINGRAHVTEQDHKDMVLMVPKAATLSPMKVHGVVVDAKGAPIAGAKVAFFEQSMNGQPNPTAESDVHGNFAFKEPVQPGGHLFAVAPDGTTGDLWEILAPEARFVLNKKACAITGRVLSDGKPLADLEVSLGAKLGESFGSSWIVKTDAEGRYQFSGLPNDLSEFYIWVKRDGFGSETIQPIRLKNQESRDLGDVSLVPSDGVVSGVVLDDKGRPLSHVEVSAQQDKEGSSEFSDEKGQFKLINVKRGQVVISARKDWDWDGVMDAQTGQQNLVIKMHAIPKQERGYVSVDVTGMDSKELDVASWFQGDPVKLSSLRGHYVLLDFFATGCQPCLASMPQIQKLQDDHLSDLTIIGVCDGSDAMPRLPKIIKAKQVKYRIAIDKVDTNGYPLNHQNYGFRGNPNLVLIDPKGKVVMTTSDIEDVELKLKKLLAPSG